MKPLPYGRHNITEADIAAVIEVLKSDFLTQGKVIPEFEAALAKYLGVKHAVVVNSGTGALHLAAAVLNIGPGNRVICTPNTFAASANCVRYQGGEVEFSDIDPQTFNLDLDKLELRLERGEPQVKGVVAVDFAGLPVDFERLRAIASRHGLWLIEDACHALGGAFLNSKNQWMNCGTQADIGVFSFHPVKHVATGEGGALTTNDDRLAERARLLRTHGITRDPKILSRQDQGWLQEQVELGYNYRMPDFCAALGLSQLRRIDENLRRRREIAAMYDEAFVPNGWVQRFDQKKFRHAYHLYVIQTSRRKELYDFLRTKNIFAQVHYLPVPMHPYYLKRYGEPKNLPNALRYYEQTLSLPMYPELTNDDVQYVIGCVRDFHR